MPVVRLGDPSKTTFPANPHHTDFGVSQRRQRHLRIAAPPIEALVEERIDRRRGTVQGDAATGSPGSTYRPVNPRLGIDDGHRQRRGQMIGGATGALQMRRDQSGLSGKAVVEPPAADELDAYHPECGFQPHPPVRDGDVDRGKDERPAPPWQ